MSVLGDAVIARDTAHRLIPLTNSTEGATSADATVLAAAVADASAQFAISAGETFDETNASHIRLAVPGVWAFLASYKGQEGGTGQIDRYISSLEDYRGSAANKRIQPLCDKTLGPTPDLEPDGTPRRPAFDQTRFGSFQVNGPASRESP